MLSIRTKLRMKPSNTEENMIEASSLEMQILSQSWRVIEQSIHKWLCHVMKNNATRG